MNIAERTRGIVTAVGGATEQVRAANVIAGSGMVDLARPWSMLAAVRDFRTHGPVAGALRIAVRRYGARTALVDEERSVTFTELDCRTDDVAAALVADGRGSGTTIAVMCRDHCAMVEAMIGATKTGAGLVLMNTGMSAVETREVCRRERVDLLIPRR
ncbi:AMP-binding protein [Gordonia zhenghanii]|uniref:AMP-binding protein n=1 Tax=Gordonia zhenghanii TaxID=2911516 RepID=UPI0027DF30E9|nr:AMP-binding protein [Gordonia zhenghanii]